MADFLNNLVARTLNLAPVVQPRLTSRFEPVRPAAAESAIEESVEVEAPPIMPPRMAVKAPEAVPTAPPVVVQHVVQREQSRVDVQQIINTVRNTQVESHEVVRERTEIEPRIHTEKTDLVLREREVSKVVPAREEVEPRVEAPPVAAKPNVVEVVREGKEKPVKSREVMVPQTVVRKEPAPFVAPPPKRIEVVPPLAAEPKETISVTIGRVDVRAVFSQQQAAPAPRRPSSINSLDDYLKQRSEGRR